MASKSQQQESANLRVWNLAGATPTNRIKQVELDGRTVTSINGMYMVQKATEMFGPVGLGWGWDIEEERYDEGQAILGGADGKQELGKTLTHTIRLKLWYELDGKRGEITQFGHTVYMRKTKYGISTDPEAPKKSLTDAMKKCLSLLGIASDVFLGMFDDDSYVQNLKTKERLEAAEDADRERVVIKAEYLEWEVRQIEAMRLAPNERARALLLKHSIERARLRAESINLPGDEAERRMREACTRIENELQQPAAANQ